MDTISVIIPVYNVEAYIAECLRTVLMQEHKGFNVECIVVDDCGSDNSMAIVMETLEKYDGDIDFKIIKHSQNKGLSAARNSGIRASKGLYIIFLDSDDFLLPGALAGMFRLTKTYQGVDVVQGEIRLDKPSDLMEPSLGISSVRLPEYIFDKKEAKRTILFKMPVTSWAKLIRRDFIVSNDLFFFEGIVHEDDMWLVCASKYISTIAFYFVPVYHYNNVRPNSIMAFPDKTKSFTSRNLIIQKAAECYIQDRTVEYFDYIILNLDVSLKLGVWNSIRDKVKARKSIKRMRMAISKTNCFPLSVASWYYSLPLIISCSGLILRVYRRVFGWYKGSYIKRNLKDE